MIKVGTILTVLDNSNVYKVKCIGSRGYSNRKSFGLRDVIVVSAFKVKNFEKGKKMLAIIANVRYPFKRQNGEKIKSQQNGVILLKTYTDDLIEPLGNRLLYTVPKEVKDAYPELSNIIKDVI